MAIAIPESCDKDKNTFFIPASDNFELVYSSNTKTGPVEVLLTQQDLKPIFHMPQPVAFAKASLAAKADAKCWAEDESLLA